VGGVEVVGRSDGVLNGGDPKGGDACPLGGDLHGVDNAPDPSVGEKCLQADLNMGVDEDTKRLDQKAARILSEVVVATWEVHRLRRDPPHCIEGDWLL
jgi:hypothetical protein